MRLTVRCSSVPCSVSARCAAGSEVDRCTGRPRRASSTATAAASVVLPTPPLPISMTRPWPSAAMSSTNAARLGATSGASGGRASSSMGAESPSRWRRAPRPTRLKALSAIRSVGSRVSATGMAARAACSRATIAAASGSATASAAGNTPLMTRYCFERPMAASSVWVRDASTSVEVCARATSTSRVRAGSARASTAALYCARCFSRPASGPRQEASPLPSSRNPVQAPGNCSMRMVWPVGAVSKMMWA
jgi:hypothetical protein